MEEITLELTACRRTAQVGRIEFKDIINYPVNVKDVDNMDWHELQLTVADLMNAESTRIGAKGCDGVTNVTKNFIEVKQYNTTYSDIIKFEGDMRRERRERKIKRKVSGASISPNIDRGASEEITRVNNETDVDIEKMYHYTITELYAGKHFLDGFSVKRRIRQARIPVLESFNVVRHIVK